MPSPRTSDHAATEPVAPDIRFDDASAQFDQQSALRHIDLHVPSGKFVAIVGPSGCGKSTLLRLAANLIHVSGGTVSVGREEQAKTGFVFQQPTLLPWRRVLDNIALPLELSGQSKAARHAAADQVRELVGLTPEDLGKLPRMLSGGMQMRVSIARALVTHPDIMLLDEPFAALDDIIRGQLNEELNALWLKQRWTTIFVTHNVAEAVFMSQRVVVMTPGPGQIAEEVEIDLPMPRQLELRGTAEFASLVGRVGSVLREAAR